jgi:N-acetylneuraminic acid mutarotase
MYTSRILRPIFLVITACCITLLVTSAQIRPHESALSKEILTLEPKRPTFSSADWYPLSNKGLIGQGVYALAVYGDDLYVGGSFTSTKDGTLTALENIARYDTKTGTWHRLSHQGLDGPVYALLVFGDNLYVGGDFDALADGFFTMLGNIVRYDMNTGKWHRLPNQGLDDKVQALAFREEDIYIGGNFDNTGDGNKSGFGCVACYDSTYNTLNQLSHSGLSDSDPPYVSALDISGNMLYVGGWFMDTGDYQVKNLNNIAIYDTITDSWYALPQNGLQDVVSDMVFLDEHLYMVGMMTSTYDGYVKNMGYITSYDTSSGKWKTLANDGLDDYPYSLAVSGEDLYVGGGFSETSDGVVKGLNQIARYDSKTNKWYPTVNAGLSAGVDVMAEVGNDLYVGGGFSETMDGAVQNLNLIARLALDVPKFNGYLPLVVKH